MGPKSSLKRKKWLACMWITIGRNIFPHREKSNTIQVLLKEDFLYPMAQSKSHYSSFFNSAPPPFYNVNRKSGTPQK